MRGKKEIPNDSFPGVRGASGVQVGDTFIYRLEDRKQKFHEGKNVTGLLSPVLQLCKWWAGEVRYVTLDLKEKQRLAISLWES